MPESSENSPSNPVVEASSKKWLLPKVTEEGFTKLVQEGRGDFHEYELDSLYVWWAGYEERRDFMLRFEKVSKSKKLPPLERREVVEEFKKTDETFEDIVDTIGDFVTNGKIDFSILGDLNDYTDKFDGWMKGRDGITVAIAEAITGAKNLTAREIRQRVAQAAFEELVSTIQAENLYYAADVEMKGEIEDSPKSEGQAVSSSLEFSPWTTEEKEKFAKIYKKWQRAVKKYYPDEIADKLKFLWHCAIGKVPPKTSVFDIIDIQWNTFEDLYNEGAMQFELDEE